jgi:hypothetical protein
MNNDHPVDQAGAAPTGAAAGKRPWRTPGLEQVDFVETEFGSGSYAPSDTTTYTS